MDKRGRSDQGEGMATPRALKENRALEAAAAVFTRYGYSRTTMGDIAQAAGMSRPALYLLFPDKDTVFARVVEALDAAKLRGIETTLAGLEALEDKLLRACLDWGLHGVELAAAHPGAADLFDLRFPAVRQVYANFEAVVAGLIAEAVARSGIGASAADLARTLVYGMRGLREGSTSVEEMRRLVAVQVRTFVCALNA